MNPGNNRCITGFTPWKLFRWPASFSLSRALDGRYKTFAGSFCWMDEKSNRVRASRTRRQAPIILAKETFLSFFPRSVRFYCVRLTLRSLISEHKIGDSNSDRPRDNLSTCISAANRTELPSQRLLHMWTSPSRLRIGRAPRKKTQP